MMQRNTIHIIIPAIAAITAYACTPEASSSCSDAARGSEFSSRDSAGVVIANTSCEAADRPLGWVVDLTPNLELGGDTKPGHQFDHIRGVVSLQDGGVVVLDNGSRELRYFDSRGTLLIRRGREGSGPGEFRSTFLVHTPESDPIVVFDSRLRRFTSFAASDTSDPRVWSADYPRFIAVGRVGDGYLFVEDVLNERVLNPGEYEQTIAYHWIRAPTGHSTVLRSFQVVKLFTVPGEGGPYQAAIPFGVHPSVAVGRRGALITSGADFDVLEFDTAGVLKRILRVDRRRRPVRPGDFPAYVSLRIAAGFGTERFWNRFADIPQPDSMRAFDAVQEDPLGWIWAKVFDYDYRKASQWLVFDPEGRSRGTVHLPPGLNVHEIGEDHILGTWKDSSGVEYVRRHSLQRGS